MRDVPVTTEDVLTMCTLLNGASVDGRVTKRSKSGYATGFDGSEVGRLALLVLHHRGPVRLGDFINRRGGYTGVLSLQPHVEGP